MSKKIAIFAFNGESTCFAHAMMNAIDMNKRGHDVRLIIEGSATRLIKTFEDENGLLTELYQKVKEIGVLDCACSICSFKMGSYENATSLKIPLCDEMMGHPSMARYIEEGYDIITF
ncbi:MAG TPA: DsrE family protein [Candidatus Methanofastidiosa archaeon]|nr:DsrE family protein [Candidatus Methanofastidiosa archaeon]